ncbi:Protein of uncharacterised function (DUF3036) [uncultured Ruminococcus sp.]|nr:Protein of uncharacterised function (DUF3036) [uncultured Ruminococcus sp.]SCH78817.1 Protein of uncharacterised function (DUF3036) [uncultured Clostridium sp.]
MKHAELVKWLKTLLLIVGAIGLVFFLWVFPVFGKEIARMDPARAYLYWPCLIFVWFSGVLLYTAFWFLWQICGEIAKDHSFCEKNAVNLGRISKIALVESVLCTVGTVVLFLLNAVRPIMLLIFVLLILVGFAVSLASAVAARLVQKASELKHDQDLTI